MRKTGRTLLAAVVWGIALLVIGVSVFYNVDMGSASLAALLIPLVDLLVESGLCKSRGEPQSHSYEQILLTRLTNQTLFYRHFLHLVP